MHVAVILCLIHEKEEEHLSVIFFDIISINKLTDTENYLSVCDIEDIPMLPIKTITSVHEGFDIHYH